MASPMERRECGTHDHRHMYDFYDSIIRCHYRDIGHSWRHEPSTTRRGNVHNILCREFQPSVACR